MDDPYERRALLLHLGDVLEALFCLSRCADAHPSIGAALSNEDSLASFSVLGFVDADMPPRQFIERAAGAFFVWPKMLLDTPLNRPLLAETVRHDVFADNEAGWAAYSHELQKSVPWFGRDLPAEPLADEPEPLPREAEPSEGKTKDKSKDEARASRYARWPWPDKKGARQAE